MYYHVTVTIMDYARYRRTRGTSQDAGCSIDYSTGAQEGSRGCTVERVSMAGINSGLTGPARSDNVNLFLARALFFYNIIQMTPA